MNPRRLESQSRALPTELHPPLFQKFTSWRRGVLPCFASSEYRPDSCLAFAELRKSTGLSVPAHPTELHPPLFLYFTSWRCCFLLCIIRPLVGNAHPTNSDNYYRISLCYKAKKQLVLEPRYSSLRFVWRARQDSNLRPSA